MPGGCPQCASPRESGHKFCPKCGFPLGEVAPSSDDPMIGRTLGGSYVVLGLVGKGGMGSVYRAEQRALRRTVAVKIIHPHLLSDPSVSNRFLSEARATSQLNHPNVVSVIDFGKTDDGLPFIVMEYLRGRSLDEVVTAEGLLPLRRVTDIVRQTLAALGEAHALGIIHRDLKPANIVLDRTRSGRDFVKVLDFGLAKTLQGSTGQATASGMVLGTPAYMSPEQACGGAVDTRADLFTVGVVLYELLTGHLPFSGDSSSRLLLARISQDAPPPGQVSQRPLPPVLVQVAARAVARSVEARYQSADEFALALEAAEEELQIDVDRPTMPAPPPGLGCPSCGERVPDRQKFCGECGTRVPTPMPGPNSRYAPDTGHPGPPSSQRRRRSTKLQLHAPAMEDDNAALMALRLGQESGTCVVRLVGDAGFGKTTLLHRFLATARAGGDVVLEVGPDPWWAKPNGYVLRQVLLALMRADPGGGEGWWTEASPEARRGLQDALASSSEVRVLEPDESLRASAAVLRWGVARAARGALTRRVVIGVDDLDRVDGVSRNALGELVGSPSEAALMVVATHGTHFRSGWDQHSDVRMLRGIARPQVLEALGGLGSSGSRFLKNWTGQTLTPLYLEQVAQYLLEGGTDPPSSTADLLTLRLQALDPQARMVLQAMSVLGDVVTLEDLHTVLPVRFEFDRALAALAAARMVDRGNSGFRWIHPLIREVVAASTPAAVRRVLCSKASEVAEAREWPLEVRALLSFHAEADLEAMFLLDLVAERAAQRGDDDGAIEALERGLEAAKREAARGELDHPTQTILGFGRKLGDALLRRGRLAQADALLREMLVIAGPASPEGVPILRGLARVERAEARSGDSHPLVPELETPRIKTGA